ncbi:MAG: glycosyltransferase family 2 protein [Sphingomonadaceae bacterium]
MSDRIAPLDITVIILSFNEEIHIARCIERIRPHVRRVVVVDSFSTDRTVEIARSLGAETLQHEFENHAQQFNWALDELEIDSEWILRLDCDEYFDERALNWFHRELDLLPDTTTAIAFRMMVVFKGTPILHGGYYSTDFVRVWRSGSSRFEERWMGERIVTTGEIHKAHGHLVDENLNSIGWWTDKHNHYATWHVVDLLMRQYSPKNRSIPHERSASRKIRFKRFIRDNGYYRAPLFLRPLMRWFYRYVLRLGFLDGKHGFIWHFLHGLWFYMLIDIKLFEARQYIRKYGIEAYERQIALVYGLNFSLHNEGALSA